MKPYHIALLLLALIAQAAYLGERLPETRPANTLFGALDSGR
jgi:hypothetical protein